MVPAPPWVCTVVARLNCAAWSPGTTRGMPSNSGTSNVEEPVARRGPVRVSFPGDLG